MTNTTDIFRELLAKNTTTFSDPTADFQKSIKFI